MFATHIIISLAVRRGGLFYAYSKKTSQKWCFLENVL